MIKLYSVFALTLMVCFILTCVQPALADELRLKDGSTLAGQVTQWAGDSVTLHTEFAGNLVIPAKWIKGVASSQTVLVQVKTGDTVVGKLVIDQDKGQLLTGTTFGDLKVDMSQVVSITAAGSDTPTTLAKEIKSETASPQAASTTAPSIASDKQAQKSGAESAVALMPATDAGQAQSSQPAQPVKPLSPAFEPATPADTAPPTKWSSRFELGLDGAAGNTDRLAIRGRIEAKRTAPSDRLLLYLQGNYAKQNSARSANEIIGGADLEVDLTPKLFVFGKTSLEYDEFEDLDLRALATGGFGYFWIREKDQTLKTRGGIGYKHESFMSGPKDDTGVLELGFDYMKQITPWLTYNHATTYYPTLSELSDFRLTVENAAEFPITTDKAWKFKVGVRNNYDAQPEPGVKKLDTLYFANLVWDFK